MSFDYLIVGCGFAGSVLAERLANDGKKILICDRRNHIGGNAFDKYNSDGILVHVYGSHILHHDSPELHKYLSKFTKWTPYNHKVLASVDGQLVPLPIGIDTINKLYNKNLDSDQLEEYFQSKAEKVDEIKTSEDVIVSRIGRELYSKFFQGYTRKQWQLDPSELDKSVTARVPTRTNRDDRYFTNRYQLQPRDGFTKLFENMLNHPNIKVMLNTSFDDIKDEIQYEKLIWTGTIDSYYQYKFGKLPYRSLEFVHETLDKEYEQPVAVINHPNENEFTRVLEHKHITGQKHYKTTITYEYPKEAIEEGSEYYPIPKQENKELYAKYRELADKEENVVFLGRLGTYAYMDMNMVIAQALNTYGKIVGKHWKNSI